MNIWRDVRKNGQGSKNHEIPDFPAQQRSGMEVSMEKKLQPLEKKRLMIFAWIAFGVPMLMGIPMGILYNKGADVSLFPNAQMYYPAAGVMLAVLLTRRQGERVPVKFYTGFLLLTASLWAMCMLQVIFPAMNMLVPMNLVIIFGSLITWILLLLEKKEPFLGKRKEDGNLAVGGAVFSALSAEVVFELCPDGHAGSVPDDFYGKSLSFDQSCFPAA